MIARVNHKQPVKKLRRLILAVPGDDKKKIEKAAGLALDEVFCDLEDAVSPNKKEEAREITASALNNFNWGSTIRAVRINGFETQWWQEDITSLLNFAGNNLDSVIAPKINNAKEVKKIDKLLTKLEKKNNIKKTIGLEILIETLEGLENIAMIAQSSARIETLIFGGGDFGANMQMRLGASEFINNSNDLLYYPRFKIIAAARKTNLDAIDAPFFNFKDEKGLAQAAHYAVSFGFAGKLIIHPAQVEGVLKYFTPSAKEIAQARKIIETYKTAQDKGYGVISVDGQMIDVATARFHQNIVDKAKLLGL